MAGSIPSSRNNSAIGVSELPRVGRSMEELRSDCVRLVAHDLNNPLTAIRILAEMLREQLHGPEMRQDVTDILEAADMAGAMMDGMSSLAMLDVAHEDFTWFPLDVVHAIREAVDRPCLRRYVRLHLPRELLINGHRVSLQRMFTDVLINARKMVESHDMVEVWAVEVPGCLELRVHHPGDGIPPSLRARIFEEYGAVELRRRRLPVAATGLTYARSVVEMHNGTISFEEATGRADRGIDLVIRLPR